MRRLSDITIEVDEPLGPPRGDAPAPQKARQAKPRRSPPARQPVRPRWLSPFLWKRRKRAALALLAGGTAAMFALWLTQSQAGHNFSQRVRDNGLALSARAGFRVEDIFVEGRNRAPRDALLTALAVHRGDPILGLDLSAARQRLEEISWVKTAVIERRLPNEVHLLITERAPIVLWQNEGRYYLVDADGQVVGDEIDEYAGLPLMVGEGAPDHAAALVALLASEPALQSKVKAAQWVGERRWNITLERAGGAVEVRLPEDDPDGAWHQLARLDREEKLLERQVAVVDMRLPDRLVLRSTAHPDSATAAKPPKRKTQSGKDA